MFGKALTTAIIFLLGAIFLQPAPYVSAPAQARANVWARHPQTRKWTLMRDEAVFVMPDKQQVWIYASVDGQLVLMADDYLVPQSEGYAGNMWFVRVMTWDEREAWRARP